MTGSEDKGEKGLEGGREASRKSKEQDKKSHGKRDRLVRQRHGREMIKGREKSY